MNEVDENYERHGFWEHLWNDPILDFKGNYKHGVAKGYWEYNNLTPGTSTYKCFYLI